MSGTVTIEKNILEDLVDETGQKARRLSFSLKKKGKIIKRRGSATEWSFRSDEHTKKLAQKNKLLHSNGINLTGCYIAVIAMEQNCAIFTLDKPFKKIQKNSKVRLL